MIHYTERCKFGFLKVQISWFSIVSDPFHKATGRIKVQQTSISEESITIFVTYSQGSETLTAKGTLKYQNGSVVRSFHADQPVFIHRFQNLTYGTRYHIELYVIKGENHVVLDSAWVFTRKCNCVCFDTLMNSK